MVQLKEYIVVPDDPEKEIKVFTDYKDAEQYEQQLKYRCWIEEVCE